MAHDSQPEGVVGYVRLGMVVGVKVEPLSQARSHNYFVNEDTPQWDHATSRK
jgi:hypothetical protein